MLRDAGWQVNDKRVERLWQREGLKVPGDSRGEASLVERRLMHPPGAGLPGPCLVL